MIVNTEDESRHPQIGSARSRSAGTSGQVASDQHSADDPRRGVSGSAAGHGTGRRTDLIGRRMDVTVPASALGSDLPFAAETPEGEHAGPRSCLPERRAS